MTQKMPSKEQAKTDAKDLRAELAAKGEPISHSQSLELISKRHGFRDWNTLSAAIGNRIPGTWTVGARVSGRFRGQAFEAQLLALKQLGADWTEVSLKLDEPIDVVSFDSFSSFRQRVTGVLGPDGLSQEKTSDGQPHLMLDK